MQNFVFYRLRVKLLSEQLGTCTEGSIYQEHVLKKAQKMIKEANRLTGKVTKIYEKFVGVDEIPEIKEVGELQGVVRRYHEVMGRAEEVPDDLDLLISYSQKLSVEFEDMVAAGEQQRATCFMRSEEGMPMLSSHMVIGNLKENLKIMTNNSTLDKKDRPVQSKVSVQEMLSLDVTPIEPFMYPDRDILRDTHGNPLVLERPIRFDRMGKTVTAIALSEQLPIGTEYGVNLRIRADSLFAANDAALLRQVLDLGKSNGFGAWRGSGGKGQFCYKLHKLDQDPTVLPDGWQ